MFRFSIRCRFPRSVIRHFVNIILYSNIAYKLLTLKISCVKMEPFVINEYILLNIWFMTLLKACTKL